MINPYDFIARLTKKLPEDAIVVCSNGTACVVYFQAGIVKKGQRVFWNSGCASMGYALPASIGASFANPGKEIICLEGDGSLMMNIQELQTIKHYDLPIKIILYSNNGYHSLQETYDNFCNDKHYGSDIGDLSFPDWQNVADTFGLEYYYMDNLEEELHDEREYGIGGFNQILDPEWAKNCLCEIVLGEYKFRKMDL